MMFLLATSHFLRCEALHESARVGKPCYENDPNSQEKKTRQPRQQQMAYHERFYFTVGMELSCFSPRPRIIQFPKDIMEGNHGYLSQLRKEMILWCCIH
jgi:hypothetical protein